MCLNERPSRWTPLPPLPLVRRSSSPLKLNSRRKLIPSGASSKVWRKRFQVTYNERFLGLRRNGPLAVAARDAAGRIVGGAIGGFYYDRLAIDLLWVDKAHRGRGLGSRILDEIETEASRQGAVRAFLDTFTFQAAPFSMRHGYRKIARIPHFFGEHDRIDMLKEPL